MSNKHQPNKSANTKQGNQQVVPKQKISPPSIPNSGAEPEQKDKKKSLCEKYKYQIEFAGFIGLVFYCVINWLEWRTFDSERKTMEQEFIASQTNAVLQMQLIQGQLDEMQKTRIEDERAWINIKGFYDQREPNVNGYHLFSIVYTDTGKTPAMHVFSTFQVIFTNVSMSLPPIRTTGGNFLPPDVDERVAYAVPVGQYNMALTNGIPAHGFGYITYQDIYGRNHWQRFSLVIELKGPRTYSDINYNDCDTNN